MDEPFAVPADPDHQAQIAIQLDENEIDGTVYYHLIYEPGRYFPDWVQLLATAVRLVKPPTTVGGGYQYESGTLQIGMVGRLTSSGPYTLGDSPVDYAIQIVRIEEGGKVLAQIEQPKNVPLALGRLYSQPAPHDVGYSYNKRVRSDLIPEPAEGWQFGTGVLNWQKREGLS